MTINLKVIDLSHHNTVGGDGPPLDGFKAAYESGIRGIIHKASQGTGYVDPMYAKRRQAALDAGLLWGAYHFATSADADAQVQHFLDTAAPDETTLLALDYEPNRGDQMNLVGARQFLTTIERRMGRKAVLYSGNLIKETIDDDADGFFGGHRLWLAHYNDNPTWPPAWSTIWLHQFSGDGINSHGIQVPGIAGQLDLNSYAKGDDDLAQEWTS